MGASWVEHESFELVGHASEVLGIDVAALLLEADQETLTRTEHAQLATFVQSLVILDATERLGLEPAFCAGHSLGEYTALVATGALSYEDGLHLVHERGAAMQDAADATNGSMLAVLGLDDDDVEAACQRAEGEVWVANFNAPGQVTIAGAPDALERAAEIARSLGAKRVASFPVGGAFHTPLMAAARERLRKALQTVTFHAPEPVVVANVDARAHGEPEEWPGLLSAQLCGPVRWRQSLLALHAAGARTFVELGPGGVLSGLAKRSLPAGAHAALSVATPADLEALVDHLAGIARSATAAPDPRVKAVAGFRLAERIVVSSGTGPFSAEPRLAHLAPTIQAASRHAGGNGASPPDPAPIAVGELVGHAGEHEIRSPFAGTLEGVLVLEGERVVAGQPVAWLRVSDEELAVPLKEDAR
jgi:[acyl-carrier-protein] S-malonyltransferase